MDIKLFDFDLPEENIALRPAVPRDTSRLLVVNTGSNLEDRNFGDLIEYLRPGDALVFNDTRVIPAQFIGLRKRDGNIARVGLTLHRRISAYQWSAFAKGAKKLRAGDHLSLTRSERYAGCVERACIGDTLRAVVGKKNDDGEIELNFELSGPALDAAMMVNGEMPLPPYIASKRSPDAKDLVDYQTIYAANDGAVAAPTAGLHFSDDMFAKLDDLAIKQLFCTLHVGAGTFLPVKTKDIRYHIMHYENGMINKETADQLNKVRQNGGRIISVGTTSLRLLESAINPDGNFCDWQGATDIFITPGYKFRAVDLLITNFHLPRSTLFMLVSAFSGLEVMHNAYEHAIRNNYRFYSYGDSSLLFPGAPN
ncbi:MAG: tRNA preQ1(34) S-adenosylmethionine ribosyltransferase-isomerase QueA [Hyphomicrobiales bacterium]|nr:tRNA preQ1(34) S-adenosylmethionine ribosyltransferase-isomerase QueA [Hyphomicrobiales bacterium]